MKTLYKALQAYLTAAAVIISLSAPAKVYADWVATNITGGFRFEDIFFINDKTGWLVGGETIRKTTNGGISAEIQFTSTVYGFRSVAFNNANLGWAGTYDGDLYKTTNGGSNWIKIDGNIQPRPVGICEMWVVGDSMWVGSGRYSGPTNFIVTTNAGASFEYYDMGAYTSYQIGTYFTDAKTGFIGGTSRIASDGAVVLRTTNGGASWQTRYKSLATREHIWQLLFNDANFGYGTVQSFYHVPWGIIITTDGGLTWVRKSIAGTNSFNVYAESIAFINQQTGWVSSGVGQGIYQTTNGGNNFTFLNIGSDIHSMHRVNDTLVYAGGSFLYKYTPTLTSIENSGEVVMPQRHQLLQNYPNPFNPDTQIRYELFRRTFVLLNVYNTAGELVETLQRGYQDKGSHSIKWDAENHPSGIYYYNLLTNEGMLNGKGVLIK